MKATNTLRQVMERCPWTAEAAEPAEPAEPITTLPSALTAPVPRIVLTAREAAAALGVSLSTLNTWQRRDNGPPSFRAPRGRIRLFPVAELSNWAAEQLRFANAQQTTAEEIAGRAT